MDGYFYRHENLITFWITWVDPGAEQKIAKRTQETQLNTESKRGEAHWQSNHACNEQPSCGSQACHASTLCIPPVKAGISNVIRNID